MKKTTEIKIGGMKCRNCVKRVSDALNALEGVSAKVDLNKGTAVITSADELPEALIRNTVEELGFDYLGM